MAQIIKVKRSSVPSKTPTVTDISLGELAINTYDGKLFLKKNVSGVETIIEVGSVADNSITSAKIVNGTIVNEDISASAAIAVSKLAASTISGVTLGNNLNTLTLNTSGTGLSGSTTYNGSGAVTFTVASNATNANTASTIVARDGSGNFSAGTITAALSGNATTATTLATSRTLWGQNFNGSANVTGNLTSVGDITGSGAVTLTATNATLNLTATGSNNISFNTNGSERFRIDSAGQIEAVSLGSAAAPTFSFTTDPNTGIYSPGADQLAIATGGSQRLTVDASGNVGIGTSAPAQNLHTIGNFLLSADTDSTKYITQKAYTINNGTLSWEGSAGQLFSITNSLTSGSIFSVNDVSGIPSIDVDANGTVELAPFGGNVGIRTTNPSSALHVNGTITTTDIDAGLGSASSPAFSFVGDTNTGIYSPGADQLAFSTGGSERLRVDASGNLGIGQTSITAVFGRTISATGVSGATFRVAGASVSGYLYASDGLSQVGLFSETNHSLVLGTNSTERLRIDPSGNVGIGTTSPGTKLDINGVTKSTSYSVSNIYDILSATLTTTSTSQAVLSSLTAASYTSVEYTIQAVQGTSIHTTKILLIEDGTTASITEYGTVTNGSNLATYDADISGANLRLLVTPNSATSTKFQVVITAIKV